MIRVKVPLDLHAVAAGGSPTFALATPMLVHQLLALAVRTAIGERAPRETVARSTHRMLTGLRDGDYVIQVDGRCIGDPNAVVVCNRTADIRFFLRRRAHARR